MATVSPTSARSINVVVAGIVAILLIAPGCSAAKFAGRATVTTISVTTTVAAATVRGGGKLARAATEASADVAAGGINAAGKLSKQGSVVFFDPRSGVVAELPWRHDLTLLAASQLAGIDGAVQAARLIRAGRALNAVRSDLPLASGDVIELTPAPIARRGHQRSSRIKTFPTSGRGSTAPAPPNEEPAVQMWRRRMLS